MNGNAPKMREPRPMSSEKKPPLACSVRPLNHEIRGKQREKERHKSALQSLTVEKSVDKNAKDIFLDVLSLFYL